MLCRERKPISKFISLNLRLVKNRTMIGDSGLKSSQSIMIFASSRMKLDRIPAQLVEFMNHLVSNERSSVCHRLHEFLPGVGYGQFLMTVRGATVDSIDTCIRIIHRLHDELSMSKRSSMGSGLKHLVARHLLPKPVHFVKLKVIARMTRLTR